MKFYTPLANMLNKNCSVYIVSETKKKLRHLAINNSKDLTTPIQCSIRITCNSSNSYVLPFYMFYESDPIRKPIAHGCSVKKKKKNSHRTKCKVRK